jgi:hypothetical protein
MKSKELRKKLNLKKQTISHLEDKQQHSIRGGANDGSFHSLCWEATQCGNTCDATCCPTSC